MKATNIWNRHLISSFPFPSWHGLCRKPFCYQLRLDNMYVHIHVICVCVWRRMLVKERMRLFYSQSIHVRQDSILSVNCLVLHCHCHILLTLPWWLARQATCTLYYKNLERKIWFSTQAWTLETPGRDNSFVKKVGECQIASVWVF